MIMIPLRKALVLIVLDFDIKSLGGKFENAHTHTYAYSHSYLYVQFNLINGGWINKDVYRL